MKVLAPPKSQRLSKVGQLPRSQHKTWGDTFLSTLVGFQKCLWTGWQAVMATHCCNTGHGVQAGQSPEVVTLGFDGSSPLLSVSSAPFWWSSMHQGQIMLKWSYNLSSQSGHFFYYLPCIPMRKIRIHVSTSKSLSWWCCRDLKWRFLTVPLLSLIDSARSFMAEGKGLGLWRESQGIQEHSQVWCLCIKEFWQVLWLLWCQYQYL